MDKDSIYKAPISDVEVRQPLPDAFRHGSLSVGKLRFAVMLSALYFLLLFPLAGFSFMLGLDPDSSSFDLWADALTIIAMLVWVYLILVFKSLLNLRLGYFGADRYILILLVLNAILSVLSILSNANEDVFSPLSIATVIGMIPLGIVAILFGRRLLKNSPDYRYLSLYAWTNIISGICTATVVLLVLAFPLSLVSTVAMAMIFLNASKELSQAQ